MVTTPTTVAGICGLIGVAYNYEAEPGWVLDIVRAALGGLA